MNQYISGLKKLVEESYDVTIFDINKFKNVYKISAVEGNFCLKQYKHDFCRFKHILDVFDYLEKREFDNILEIIETYSHKKYIEFDNVYFYMTKWIESRELNYSNSYDVIRASQHIAKFHNHTKGYKPSTDVNADSRWFKWLDIFEAKLRDIYVFKEMLNSKKELTIFDKIYSDNIDKNIDLAKESMDLLCRFDYEDIIKEHSKRNYICHHDLANHNILLDSYGKIYFIDFDYIILDTYLHDLGSFVQRCLKFGRWSKDKFRLIINSYKDVKYIPKREILLMMAFILFPNDFWQVGIQRYKENILWTDDRFLKRLTRFENDKDDKVSFIRDIIFQ